MTKPRKRSTNKIEDREAKAAALAVYVRELERAKVPPLVVKQAGKLIAILLGAQRE